jgi:choline-sulfatase
VGDRPNILLLMTDQQRWDAMSCASEWLETPNIDRIAAEGVRFSDAYANSPVCIPSRVSLATGHYPHDHGVWGNVQEYALPPETPTWMRSLRDAGYATSVFGKTHLHPHLGDLRDREPLLNALGLDHVDELSGPRATARCRSNWTDRLEEAGLLSAYVDDMRERYDSTPWLVRPSPLPLSLYPDVYIGQQAKQHLRGLGTDRPWFSWVSFVGPHEPWDCPEPYASRFDPDDMPAPLRRRQDPPTPVKRAKGRVDRRMRLRPDIDRKQIARMRADYAGSVALIDDQVGELLGVLEERGELDRTVVAFVSDHGEMNGDFKFIYKGLFYNGAVRVPFVVRAPGLAGGAVTDTPVELMDIGATLVDLAGAAQPEGSRARSVVPVLRDPSHSHREFALSEQAGEVMIATSDWKLTINSDSEPYQLFDLRNDPDETCNLAGTPENAAVEKELLLKAMTQVVDTLPDATDAPTGRPSP